MRENLFWFVGGAVVFFIVLSLLGGLYTITPPSGPSDVAYKVNRLTGRVWMIKTYSKQVGPMRVLTAREAVVEKTKQIAEADMPAVAMEQPLPPASSARRR